VQRLSAFILLALTPITSAIPVKNEPSSFDSPVPSSAITFSTPAKGPERGIGSEMWTSRKARFVTPFKAGIRPGDNRKTELRKESGAVDIGKGREVSAAANVDRESVKWTAFDLCLCLLSFFNLGVTNRHVF